MGKRKKKSEKSVEKEAIRAKRESGIWINKKIV